MKVVSITCLNIVLIVCTAMAQQPSLEIQTGAQGLQYQLNNGESMLRAGGSLDIGYSYPLGGSWDLLTGVGGGYYSTKATSKDGTVYSSYEVDNTGSAFQYNITTRGYTETQQFFAVGIPVKLYYNSSGKTKWYANAGVRVVVPFRATLKASAQALSRSAYYPDYNIEIDDLEQHGFGTTTNWQGKASQSLNATVAASAGTGLNFTLARFLHLYTGVYAEYGLTTMRTRDDQSNLIKYDRENPANSRLAGLMSISGKGRLVSYGLQVRLTMR